MPRYRKKPVVVTAVQWTGMNTEEISQFIPPQHLLTPVLKWREFEVGTLEGKHTASMGDFIIRGVAGEYYPCKPDIFAQTYEEVYSDGTA